MEHILTLLGWTGDWIMVLTLIGCRSWRGSPVFAGFQIAQLISALVENDLTGWRQFHYYHFENKANMFADYPVMYSIWDRYPVMAYLFYLKNIMKLNIYAGINTDTEWPRVTAALVPLALNCFLNFYIAWVFYDAWRREISNGRMQTEAASC